MAINNGDITLAPNADLVTPADKMITAIIKRDFHTWTGIPANFLYDDFCSNFPATHDNYGLGRLGRYNEESYYRKHTIEGYGLSAQTWYVGDDIRLIELHFPQLTNTAPELRNCLGEPAIEIDYHLDIALISKGAWLYPEQGIGLFTDHPGLNIMKIYLFHPCTLKHYLDVIHVDAEMEELPE